MSRPFQAFERLVDRRLNTLQKPFRFQGLLQAFERFVFKRFAKAYKRFVQGLLKGLERLVEGLLNALQRT